MNNQNPNPNQNQNQNQNLLTDDDYMALPMIEANTRLFYGSASEQFGDLYLPTSKPKKPKGYPVIILIHGGFWKYQYDLKPLSSLAHALTEIGCAVWNIEYRSIGNGGGFPETFNDVMTATEFLHDISNQYNLDMTHVFSMGHSAGGQLALWLAARHKILPTSPLWRENPLPICGVVALAAIADLIAGAKENLGDSAVQKFLGGDINTHIERYHASSPHALLPFNVTQWHIIGEHDDCVPLNYLEEYVNHARLHGPVLLDILPNTGHFELVDPKTDAWPIVRNAISSLLKLQSSGLMNLK